MPPHGKHISNLEDAVKKLITEFGKRAAPFSEKYIYPVWDFVNELGNYVAEIQNRVIASGASISWNNPKMGYITDMALHGVSAFAFYISNDPVTKLMGVGQTAISFTIESASRALYFGMDHANQNSFAYKALDTIQTAVRLGQMGYSFYHMYLAFSGDEAKQAGYLVRTGMASLGMNVDLTPPQLTGNSSLPHLIFWFTLAKASHNEQQDAHGHNDEHSSHTTENHEENNAKTHNLPTVDHTLTDYLEKLNEYISSNPEQENKDLVLEGLTLAYTNVNYRKEILSAVQHNLHASTYFLDELVNHVNEGYKHNDEASFDIMPIAYVIIKELAKHANITHLPEHIKDVKEWASIYPNFEEKK